MQDNEIVDLYWARSEDAISQTNVKYGSYCRGIALHILRSREDSEECVSDTWLKTWESIPPQRPVRLGAYVGRITRNLSLNRLKAMRRQKRGGGEVIAALEELDETLPSPFSVEEDVDARELAALLDRFLDELSSENRNIFLQRYWYFCSVGEIASACSVSQSKVKMSLLRSRNRLKKYLQGEGYIRT